MIRDVVSAALAVHLFSAMLFAKLYLMLELAYPGSFSISHETIRDNPGLLKYFSMVTLSTLGYGDLSPVNDKSQTLASMEAIFGQIYLAVLMPGWWACRAHLPRRFQKNRSAHTDSLVFKLDF